MSGCQCKEEEAALDLVPLDQLIDEFAGVTGATIPLLQRAQEIYGYLPKRVLAHIAQRTCTPMNQIFGVATFYSQFYLHRRGKHIIRQCDGTACHVRGSGKIVENIEHELGIKAGETTADYQYTFEVVYCLGSCGLSPVATVNEKVLGRLGPNDMTKVIRELQ